MVTGWGESASKFAGGFITFDGVVEHPRPLQRPNPPIIIGGHVSSSYRRAVQLGNGWYGWELDLDETAKALAQLREATARYPRPPELGQLEISITPRGMGDVDTARRYADLGVQRVGFFPPALGSPPPGATLTPGAAHPL